VIELSNSRQVCSTLLVQNKTQRAHKRLVNVFITFMIFAFRIGSECPFIERLVLVQTFS